MKILYDTYCVTILDIDGRIVYSLKGKNGDTIKSIGEFKFEWFRVSPDLGEIAIIGSRDDKEYLILNGEIIDSGEKIEQFSFSNDDSARYCYIKRLELHKAVAVVDGKEVAKGWDIPYLEFSPTGRYLCVVCDDMQEVIVDGKKVGVYSTVSKISWWQDKYGFVGVVDGMCELVVNGDFRERYPFIWSFDFGPKGEVIVVIKTNKGAVVKVDGKVIDVCEDIKYFTVGNNCIIYDARKNGHTMRIVRKI